jgi:uncharacterized protein (TIRG00374 family)
VLRFVLGLALLGAVLYVLRSHTQELSGLSGLFSELRWWWLVPALGVEAASFVAFALIMVQLLDAGGVRAPLRPLVGVTLASQAITNSLPLGTALAAVYGFRWFRRMGADDTIAGWALVGTMVTASVSLALVAAAGVALAAELSASLDLIPVVIGVLIVAVAVGVLFVYERPLAVGVSWALHAMRKVVGRPRGDMAEQIRRVVDRVTAVRLTRRRITVVLGCGVANWLLDCGCFAFSFLAVGSPIPWEGLLLAYGAGQLAANLPITPGGLGAVEGSITIALVAFGGSRVSTVEAVIIYRLISFWGEMVVGWLSAGWLALGVRRGRWTRRVRAAPARVSELATLPEGVTGSGDGGGW